MEHFGIAMSLYIFQQCDVVLEEEAEVVVGLGVLRIDGDGRPVLLLGLRVLLHVVLEEDAEVVVGYGVLWIDGDYNVADLGTKALPAPRFHALSKIVFGEAKFDFPDKKDAYERKRIKDLIYDLYGY